MSPRAGHRRCGERCRTRCGLPERRFEGHCLYRRPSPIKPAFGYRRLRWTLCGTLRRYRYSENLIRFSQGTDVLIHEVIDPQAYLTGDHLFSQSDSRKSDRAPHQSGAGRNDFQPGEAEVGGLFSHRAVRRAQLGGTNPKNLFRTAGVGEHLMSIEIGSKVEIRRSSK
jgi:ribonuclease Z